MTPDDLKAMRERAASYIDDSTVPNWVALLAADVEVLAAEVERLAKFERAVLDALDEVERPHVAMRDRTESSGTKKMAIEEVRAAIARNMEGSDG